MPNNEFWSAFETLVNSGEIVIDRPAGTAHPQYPKSIYPYDYGYIAGTQSGDGAGVDVWVCEPVTLNLTGLLCTVNTGKKDAEIKILLGCSAAQTHDILSFHNCGKQRAIAVMRDNTEGETS